MDAHELELRQQLIETAQFCEGRDLLMYTQGNFSARIPGTDRVLITPSDVPYPTMVPEDIVEVDLDGKKVSGKHSQSSETAIHTTAMRRNPEVMACAHVESPYVNALYSLDLELPNILGNFTYLFAGKGLALGPSIRSANQDFAEKTLDAMGEKMGVVWKNHGMFCVGPDIKLAMKRCMAAEQAGRVYYLALCPNRGTPDLIPQDVQKDMVETAIAHGWAEAAEA
jgi:ribulose-5-phosphate 4-epimerase/fuculose-1-phosphate aldolase